MKPKTHAPNRPDFARARKAAARHLDWRYKAIYDFLQISPSYMAAHEMAMLGKTQLPLLPSDFDKVREVYDRLGSVWGTSFHDWWYNTGQYEIGVKVDAPIGIIGDVESLRRPTAADQAIITRRLVKSLSINRDIIGLPRTLILSVPLRGASKDILKSLRLLFEKLDFDTDQIGSYRLVRSKVREAAVRKSLAVVRRRASAPRQPIWQVAVRANVRKDLTDLIRDSGKGLASLDHKNEVSANMSRYSKRAYLLAENAARGSFPNEMPLPPDIAVQSFNFAVLNRVYRREISSLEKQIANTKRKLAALKARPPKGSK